MSEVNLNEANESFILLAFLKIKYVCNEYDCNVRGNIVNKRGNNPINFTRTFLALCTMHLFAMKFFYAITYIYISYVEQKIF